METTFKCSASKGRDLYLANGKARYMVDSSWLIGNQLPYYSYDNQGLWQEADAAEIKQLNANRYKFEAGMVRPKRSKWRL